MRWWRARSQADFDEEIRAHLELEADRLRAEGMPEAQASATARRRFGNVTRTQERFHEANPLRWLEELAQDLRHGMRTLRRDARLTVFAVLIVGLGIGASATVFSAVHALLLRPLPFRNAGELVWISNGNSADLSGRTIQVAHVWRLRAESRSFSDVAGYSEFYGDGDHSLTGVGEPERLTGLPVTEHFFALLGVQPALGRLFTPEEAVEGAPKAVLLGHRFWMRRFGSDPGIVGQSLTIDGAPVNVVGVLPASFEFGTIFAPGRRIDFYSPFPLSARTNRSGNTLALVGRLRPGTSVAEAQLETTALIERAGRADGVNEFTPRVIALREHVSGAFRPAMLVLAGAVGLVMLMVCANLSNLLLTRTAAREKEMALRVTLGARRGRLVRQLLTESVVLSCAGAMLGLLLALAGTQLLSNTSSINVPLLEHVRVDWTVLGFTTAITVLTGLAFGLTPALRISAPTAHDALKDASRGSSAGIRHRWIRGTLVVSEISVALVLLVGAGLLTRSFLHVLEVDLGFRPERVIALRIDPSARFPTPALRTAFYDEALHRVRAAPGIEAAGLADVLPMGFNRQWSVGAEGRSYARGERPHAFVRVVSEGYLSAMSIALVAGRDFSARDDESRPPVGMVNEALARTLWPGEDPLGRMLHAGYRDAIEVVGVVAGTRHQSLEQDSGGEVYFPLRQTGDFQDVHVIARGAVPPSSLVTAVRSALRPMDPTLPMTEVRVMQDIVERSTSPRRFIVLLLVGFASFALLLAALGIYAVISYGVTQRRHEFGIRLALGAPAGGLQTQIVAQTAKLAAAGIALGLAVAWGLARLLEGLLFGVSVSDPTTFTLALSVLGVVAVLAGYLPARRASRLNPADALRAR